MSSPPNTRILLFPYGDVNRQVQGLGKNCGTIGIIGIIPKKRSWGFHPSCDCFSSIEAEFDSASDRTAKPLPLRLIPGGFTAVAREQRSEHSHINILRHDTDVSVYIGVDHHSPLMI